MSERAWQKPPEATAARAIGVNGIRGIGARAAATGHPGGLAYAQVPLASPPALARREDAAEPDQQPPVGDLVAVPKDNDEVAATRCDGRAGGVQKLRLLSPIRAEGPTTGARDIATVLRPGARPQTFDATAAGGPRDMAHAQTAAPGGTPALGNGSNDCTPNVAATTLAWDVVSADAANWGVDVVSLTLAGTVNVKPWPSNPTSMTVPNTANPVDGGNINNTAGSDNHWKAAIDDMADYHTPGGGAGPNWHSTDASHAHEWAHWNTDYLADSVASAAGGNWPQANIDLDALRQPKATSATPADARTALQGRVNTRLATWRAATVARWNAIPDTPGTPGSTGYVAGAAVLAGLITSVRAYATAKGWIAAPAAPARPPAPGP